MKGIKADTWFFLVASAVLGLYELAVAAFQHDVLCLVAGLFGAVVFLLWVGIAKWEHRKWEAAQDLMATKVALAHKIEEARVRVAERQSERDQQ